MAVVKICIYISICPLIWWYTGRTRSIHFKNKKKILISQINYKIRKNYRVIFLILIIIPLILLIFAPFPLIYRFYFPSKRLLRSNYSAMKYHILINLSTLIRVISSAGLILFAKKFFRSLLFLFPFL